MKRFINYITVPIQLCLAQFRFAAVCTFLLALLFAPLTVQAQVKNLCDSATKCAMSGDAVVGDDLSIGGDLEYFGAAHGGGYTMSWVTAQTAALTSGGTANCGTNLIPAGSNVFGCIIRVTTLVTGATSIDVGDGSDADKWGDNIAVTAGTTTTGASFTTGTATPINYPSATNLVLTANGSNFTAGVVRCACLVGRFTAFSN